MSTLKRVSPEEAKALMENDGYTYLDVRTEAEYATGHPTGAHNVPVMLAGPAGMAPNPDFVAHVSALYAKDQKLVLGCKSGGRSMRAAELLLGAGFTNIVDQRAGFDGPRDAFGQVSEPGWGRLDHLPTETETPGGAYAELKKKAT